MRVVLKALVLSQILALCLSTLSTAQQAGRIESMKLMASDVGWAATNKKVFWTADNGAHWKDITPRLNHKRQTVSSVFFLDVSSGWVLLSCGDDRDPIADNLCFELASTTDAGQTWSALRETIAAPFSREQLENGHGFSGRSWLHFADSQHGWEILDTSTNSANASAGEMLRTADGGKTWTLTKEVPTADHFYFLTGADGWIAGGKDHELYVTHDAGDSWRRVLLPAAAGTEPNLGVDYALPVFESARRGFLSVQYSLGPVAGHNLTTLALFTTDDGGSSWKLDRILPKLPGTFTSGVVDSAWLGAHSEMVEPSTGRTNLQLRSQGSDHTLTSNVSNVSSFGKVTQLSFLSRDQGWINMSDRLLSTKNAGRTWEEITPAVARADSVDQNLHPEILLGKLDRSRSALAWQPQAEDTSPSSPNVSTHLGFEAYNVPPDSTMSTWMSSSPYYDIGIYLQGSKNGHKDPILSSASGKTWVSTVVAQGWGFIPTWVGLQSPCACRYKNNQCLQYLYFSSNPNSDGIAEADAAIAAAQSLGITTPIIYKDIENYYGNTALCTSAQQAAAALAVQAFVGGWDSELHSHGYLAGVYGNPNPAKNDFSKASPIPDDYGSPRHRLPVNHPRSQLGT